MYECSLFEKGLFAFDFDQSSIFNRDITNNTWPELLANFSFPIIEGRRTWLKTDRFFVLPFSFPSIFLSIFSL